MSARTEDLVGGRGKQGRDEQLPRGGRTRVRVGEQHSRRDKQHRGAHCTREAQCVGGREPRAERRQQHDDCRTPEDERVERVRLHAGRRRPHDLVYRPQQESVGHHDADCGGGRRLAARAGQLGRKQVRERDAADGRDQDTGAAAPESARVGAPGDRHRPDTDGKEEERLGHVRALNRARMAPDERVRGEMGQPTHRPTHRPLTASSAKRRPSERAGARQIGSNGLRSISSPRPGLPTISGPRATTSPRLIVTAGHPLTFHPS